MDKKLLSEKKRMRRKITFRSLVFLLLLGSIAVAQTVTYEEVPSDYQLYPRDETDADSAVVTIHGTVDGTGYDSVIVDVYRDDVLWKKEGIQLNYSGSVAMFTLTPKIYADLVEFKFDIRIGAADNVVTDSLVDNVVCGDVYLITGQSNAVAFDIGGFSPYLVEWVRSFGTSEQAETQNDTSWDLAQAENFYTHAAIGIWGLRLGELISETYDIPVCFINGAVGGTKSWQHRKGSGEEIYENLFWRAQMAGVIDDVKAIIWNQGENNCKDDGDAEDYYYGDFPDLRDDWRADYTSLDKIYTAQIHVGYKQSDWEWGKLVREFQRRLAEDDVDIEIMTMHNLPGFDEVHYAPIGYDSLAFRLFRQIRRDFYGSSDDVDIDPPNISQAYFTDEQKDVLILEFDNTNNLILQNDSTVSTVKRYLKDYFYLLKDTSTADVATVDSLQVFGNLLRLELSTSSSATRIIYLPDRYYNGTTQSYIGPWLKSSRDIPALSFFQFHIDATTGDDPLPVTLSAFSANYLNGIIKLKWRTESEVNNLGFILLRKTEKEQDFQEIANYQYEPALQGHGNTSQATDYEFSDSRVTDGETYVYLLMDVDYSGNKTPHGPISLIAKEEGSFPQGYKLYQNYPNPFNPSTNIAFFLPQQQHVLLRILDTLGQEVEILIDSQVTAGYHEAHFEANNLRSGHYFYEIRTAEFTNAKKMLLLK